MMRLGCKVTVFLPYSQIFLMFFVCLDLHVSIIAGYLSFCRDFTSAYLYRIVVALYLHYAYADYVFRNVLTVEFELVAVMALGNIGDVETADYVRGVPLKSE